MIDLDNPSIYRQFDKSGMLNHLREFSPQCSLAWDKILKSELPREYSGVDKIIILGMGGSAIGGEIVRRLAWIESKVPVWVHRDYDLPPFVDKNTLIIASSYSGNTEEILTAFTEALKTPAKKLVLTGGGKLKDIADSEGIPVFVIDYRAPPRAVFPYSFLFLVGIFQKLGLLSDKSADMEETLLILDNLSGDLAEPVPLTSNPAKQLAGKLWGCATVIYGAGILSEVAQRWKAQLNENSKAWAFFELFPELNHNAVVGYQFPPQLKERIFVVLLHSNLLHPRSRLRYQATAKLLTMSEINHEIVAARGECVLAQMMSMVLFGDYVSFYLAMLNGIDPTPVDSINFLKKLLAQSDD